MREAVDEDLSRGLGVGREEAFTALYDRFSARLYRFAKGVLGSAEEAEDAVQEVFVGLVRARSFLGAVENVAAYLFASVRREAARRVSRGYSSATSKRVEPASLPSTVQGAS